MVNNTIKEEIAYMLNTIKEESKSNNDIRQSLADNAYMLDDILSFYSQKIYDYYFIQAGRDIGAENIYIRLQNTDNYQEVDIDEITLQLIFDSTYDNCELTYNKSEVK